MVLLLEEIQGGHSNEEQPLLTTKNLIECIQGKLRSAYLDAAVTQATPRAQTAATMGSMWIFVMTAAMKKPSMTTDGISHERMLTVETQALLVKTAVKEIAAAKRFAGAADST